MLKSMKECEKMTNVKLLAQISNRETLMQAMPGNQKSMQYKNEINKIWELMQKNGYKK